ncbi:MAG: hypothetical protein IPK75_20510 [Acidobacteria bacterium]|nr:hypothetical protein [Acidobacteriota bacterium]
MTGDFFLLPAAARVWRIVANQYQFFIYENGTNGTVSRRFAAAGVPFVPTWNVPFVTNSTVWGISDGDADGSGTARSTWRTCPSYIGCSVSASHGNVYQLNNTGSIEGTNVNNNSQGAVRFVLPFSAQISSSLSSSNGGRRFMDDSWFISDAWIAYDTAAFTNEAKVVGMAWDALWIVQNTLTADTTFTFDGHTFIVITVPNTASTTAQHGQLCIRVS